MAETIGGERPKRIQRKRSKGWKMPPNTVYVGRPTRWGNPYHVEEMDEPSPNGRENAVLAYRAWIYVSGGRGPKPSQIKRELRGKNLACWCPLVDKDGKPVPCHADILLEIANS